MSSDRRAVAKTGLMSATGPRRKRMSLLCCDVGDEGVGFDDIRVMARMYHTGVPLVDIAYIFGVTPSLARLCVWRYVWYWLGTEDSPDDDAAQDKGSDFGDKEIPCGLP